MLKLLMRLLWDESAAVGVARAACLGLGTAQMTGQLDGLIGQFSPMIGTGLVALGGYLRSSSHPSASPAGNPTP